MKPFIEPETEIVEFNGSDAIVASGTSIPGNNSSFDFSDPSTWPDINNITQDDITNITNSITDAITDVIKQLFPWINF